MVGSGGGARELGGGALAGEAVCRHTGALGGVKEGIGRYKKEGR